MLTDPEDGARASVRWQAPASYGKPWVTRTVSGGFLIDELPRAHGPLSSPIGDEEELMRAQAAHLQAEQEYAQFLAAGSLQHGENAVAGGSHPHLHPSRAGTKC